MPNDLAAVADRINLFVAQIESGETPDRARLEDTLTDGYAWALSLDAECDRIERRIAEQAAKLTEATSAEHTRHLSSLARLLARRRRELHSLRDLLAILRAGVQEARVA